METTEACASIWICSIVKREVLEPRELLPLLWQSNKKSESERHGTTTERHISEKHCTRESSKHPFHINPSPGDEFVLLSYRIKVDRQHRKLDNGVVPGPLSVIVLTNHQAVYNRQHGGLPKCMATETRRSTKKSVEYGSFCALENMKTCTSTCSCVSSKQMSNIKKVL